MLKVNVNKEALDIKKQQLISIYGSKWVCALAFKCECSRSLIWQVFRAEKNDNLDIEKNADFLIERGKNIPKNVSAFLKTVRYGKSRDKSKVNLRKLIKAKNLN